MALGHIGSFTESLKHICRGPEAGRHTAAGERKILASQLLYLRPGWHHG